MQANKKQEKKHRCLALYFYSQDNSCHILKSHTFMFLLNDTIVWNVHNSLLQTSFKVKESWIRCFFLKFMKTSLQQFLVAFTDSEWRCLGKQLKTLKWSVSVYSYNSAFYLCFKLNITVKKKYVSHRLQTNFNCISLWL